MRRLGTFATPSPRPGPSLWAQVHGAFLYNVMPGVLQSPYELAHGGGFPDPSG